MKKILCVLLVGIMLIGFASCGNPSGETEPIGTTAPTPTTESTPVDPEPTEPSESSVPTEPSEPSDPSESTEPSEPTEPSTEPSVPTEPTEPSTEPSEPVAQPVTFRIYLPNDSLSGFVTESVTVEELTPEAVLNVLKSYKMLTEAVTILDFRFEDGLITIDFNHAFADIMYSMGTTGELMVVGNLVNTYLDAYQAEALYFTVEGEILNSGHVIYDSPLSFIVPPSPTPPEG